MPSERTILLRKVEAMGLGWRERYEVLRLTMKIADAAKKTLAEYREKELEPLFKAIREGRATLETAWGMRKVVGYNDETGWAVTNNTGDYSDQRSFMVCRDAIKIS